MILLTSVNASVTSSFTVSAYVGFELNKNNLFDLTATLEFVATPINSISSNLTSSGNTTTSLGACSTSDYSV